MTVNELIEKLSKFDSELQVMIVDHDTDFREQLGEPTEVELQDNEVVIY